MINKLLALCATLTLCACASKPSLPRLVKVYQFDGAHQCESRGISPTEMQKSLGNIRVYAAQKSVFMGIAFPAVCGGGTNSINVYTIAECDLTAAQQRGFHELKPQH